uniref:Reverse transcriptase domain-containing protein n=1 Tax=Tanacetum cinerariifolium TaxID=118510 RepID=A0A699HNX0_TANCI|nr:hypothetical protein [Tanacetum cinerariifolium]
MMLELIEVCRQKEFYCMHDNVDDLIESALNSKLLLINFESQRLDKKKQEVKNVVEQPIELGTQPEYSLSMGYEHLNTTSKMESDEIKKSGVKNLLLIPCEYEVISDDESECEVPIKEDSSPAFTTFSNPLFNYNDDFTSSDDKSLPDEDVLTEELKVYLNLLFDDEEISYNEIDQHCFNAESDLIESLLNRNTLIDSSPKFDFLLKEFSVEDSDSLIDEIDLFLATDELLPLNIESDGYGSEGDIHFLEELLIDDFIPFPINESSDFKDDPLFPRILRAMAMTEC